MNRLALVTVLLVLVVVGALLSSRRHPSRQRAQPLPSFDSSRVTQPAGIGRKSVVSADVSEPADISESGAPKVAREKVEAYLARHRRSPASLLAAFHGTEDTNYLFEAARNFPEDPQVQWTILGHNLFPEDRRKWLDAFKASSPSNSLANYLSAQEYFNGGNTEAAVQELRAASGKTQFDSFETGSLLDAEELYLSAGQSPLEASSGAMAAVSQDMLSELSASKLLTQSIAAQQSQYASAGDAESSATMAQAGLAFADQLRSGDSGKYLINGLVGNACEAILLKGLDSNTAYAFLGGATPAQRLDELKQIKQDIRQVNKDFSAIFPTLSEPEQINYLQRSRIYGEFEAMRWLQQQYGASPQAQ